MLFLLADLVHRVLGQTKLNLYFGVTNHSGQQIADFVEHTIRALPGTQNDVDRIERLVVTEFPSDLFFDLCQVGYVVAKTDEQFST